MITDNKLSLQVEDQIPDFVGEYYPLFVTFMTSYFQWLDQGGNPQNVIQSLQLNRDIDSTNSSLVTKFMNQYMSEFPQEPAADKSLLVKHFRRFYERKGTTSSFEFFFRAFFDDEVAVNRPADILFSTSDGEWYIETYLRVAALSGDPMDLLHTTIVGSSTGATAAVDQVHFVNEGSGDYYNVTLQPGSLIGTFSSSETIRGYLWNHTTHVSSLITMTAASPVITRPGRWLDNKSQISSDQILQDSFYYHRYSYVIKSRINRNLWYRSILNHIHPAGTRFFSEHIMDGTEVNATSAQAVTLTETTVKIPVVRDFYVAPGYGFDRLANFKTGTSTTTSVGAGVTFDSTYTYAGENVTFALQNSGDDGTRPQVVLGGASFDKIGAGVSTVPEYVTWGNSINSSVIVTKFNQSTSIALSANATLANFNVQLSSNLTSILVALTWHKDPVPQLAANETSNALSIQISTLNSAQPYIVDWDATTQRNFRNMSVGSTLVYPRLTYLNTPGTTLTSNTTVASGSSTTTVQQWTFTPANRARPQSYSRAVFRISAVSGAQVNILITVSSNAVFNAAQTDFLNITEIGASYLTINAATGSDSSTVTDTRFQLMLTKRINDTATMSDLAGIGDGLNYGYSQLKTDTVTATDLFVRNLIISRLFNTDQVILGSGLNQRQSTLERMSFFVRKLLRDTSTMIDSADISDGLTFRGDMTFYNILALTENIGKKALLYKAETASLADISVLLPQLRKTEAVTSTDTQRTFWINKGLRDTTTMLDLTGINDGLNFYWIAAEFETIAEIDRPFMSLRKLVNSTSPDAVTIGTDDANYWMRKLFRETLTVTDDSDVVTTGGATTAQASLIFDLDAQAFGGVPSNGTVVSGYTITVINSGGTLGWTADNSGVFRKQTGGSTDYISIPGLDARTTSYTVFIAVKTTNSSTGRTLTTANANDGDWFGPNWNGNLNAYYAGGFVSNGETDDGVWRLVWMTGNKMIDNYKIYSAVPGDVEPTLVASNNRGANGFQGLRLFSRVGDLEVATGDIGFVRVYNGELSSTTITALYNANYARFV
jgi:hypothetical protein